jgi:hypothetical protein
MSGPHRFEHEPKTIAVSRRRRAILFLVGFVALGIIISLAFAYYGWAPIE